MVHLRLPHLRPRLLKPDIVLSSIHDLTADIMREHGIRCLVLDVDDTLTYHGGMRADKATIAHLESLKAQAQVVLFIASNSRRDLQAISEQIGAQIIHSTLLSRKPRRRHFRRIVRETGFPAHQTAMIGDKLLTDVLGGNLAGMTTVWVLSRKQKYFNHD